MKKGQKIFLYTISIIVIIASIILFLLYGKLLIEKVAGGIHKYIYSKS